jgi:hypothetical protein
VSKKRNVSYYLAENGKFIIENYDLAKPFASFFPGIAGLFGIPMWVFYVNRGQGIVSFGTQDKKNSILEFFPANRAWEVASSRGFRTFVKINGREVYEPFQNNAVNAGKDLQRLMSIGTDDFSVSESNRTLGLQFNARYFTLANEPLACLIRILTIKNTSKTKKTLRSDRRLAAGGPVWPERPVYKGIGADDGSLDAGGISYQIQGALL